MRLTQLLERRVRRNEGIETRPGQRRIIAPAIFGGMANHSRAYRIEIDVAACRENVLVACHEARLVSAFP
jgi:hypothetical protein